MKSPYTNIRPLGVIHRINKYESCERAFCELFIPNFTNLKSLRSGPNIPIINLRPREVLGLCLMCHKANQITDNNWTIATDPLGQDGAIVRKDDSVDKKGNKRGLIIEQVYIPNNETPFIKEFENALNKKLEKGEDYVKNLNLLILSEYGEKEDFNKIIPLAQKSNFKSVYFFVLRNPIPYMFESATLKSPADPLEYYSIGINPLDGSSRIIPKGYFKSIA